MKDSPGNQGNDDVRFAELVESEPFLPNIDESISNWVGMSVQHVKTRGLQQRLSCMSLNANHKTGIDKGLKEVRVVSNLEYYP